MAFSMYGRGRYRLNDWPEDKPMARRREARGGQPLVHEAAGGRVGRVVRRVSAFVRRLFNREAV